jgi:hypothetical protein
MPQANQSKIKEIVCLSCFRRRGELGVKLQRTTVQSVNPHVASSSMVIPMNWGYLAQRLLLNVLYWIGKLNG